MDVSTALLDRSDVRLPGVLMSILIGAASVGAVSAVPAIPSPLLVGLLVGAVMANLSDRIGASTQAGAIALSGPLLRAGLVLLGARGSLALVGDIGPAAAVVIAATMTIVFATAWLAARAGGVPAALAALIGVGTAICGNSAIAAAAPLVGARRAEVAFAVAAITFFGTSAVVVYPILGHAFGLSAQTFGLWAGAGVHDTAQVIATGFAFSPVSGQVATIVKLARNTLILPVLAVLAVRYRNEAAGASSSGRTALVLVGGYLALAVLNTVGAIPPALRDGLAAAAMLAITVAITAVGLALRVADLRAVPRRAIVAAFASTVSAGLVSLALALAMTA